MTQYLHTFIIGLFVICTTCSTPTTVDPQTDFNIVYTWVNGSDPILLQEMRQFKKQISIMRIRDREELKYSLRSVEKYMPWFQGKILIFTNHNPPDWLNMDHPRVSVITHKEIIPETYLPTFNSDGIEYFISTLPGLGERFVYLNDDMFIGDYVEPGDLFTSDGRPLLRFTPSNKVQWGMEKHDIFKAKRSNKWLANIYYTHSLLEDRYGDGDHGFLHHAPYPMLKKALDTIKTNWPEQSFHAVTQRSRDYSSIQTPSLHHWLCQDLGWGIPYFDSNPKDEYHFITATTKPAMQQSLGDINKKNVKFYNVADYPAELTDDVLGWFDKKYPLPSSFEKIEQSKAGVDE